MNEGGKDVWDCVLGRATYLLPLSDFLLCRCVCKKWETVFSFDVLCHRLHLAPHPGSQPRDIIHGVRYLVFVELWDLHTLERELPFGRCRSAAEHVVQGNLRRVWYEGTLEEGTLFWSVQPSVGWSVNGGKGYTVVSDVKQRKASIPSCNCPHGG